MDAARDTTTSAPAAVQLGRRLLSSLPGSTVGDTLASEVLVAARMRRTTSYTEFNAAVINRTDTAGFNFDLDADRVAIGELFGQMSEDTISETDGLLLSALVQYLDANDAGPGFTPSPDAKPYLSLRRRTIVTSSGLHTWANSTSTTPGTKPTRAHEHRDAHQATTMRQSV